MSIRPTLNEIKHIRAIRGNFTLEYSITYTTGSTLDNNLKTLDFLQIKIMNTKTIPRPAKKKSFRGFLKIRKNETIKNFFP